jgi:hypothetical protein
MQAVIPTFTSMGASLAFAEQIQEQFQAIEAGKLEAAGAGGRLIRGTIEAEALFAALLRPALPPS